MKFDYRDLICAVALVALTATGASAVEEKKFVQPKWEEMECYSKPLILFEKLHVGKLTKKLDARKIILDFGAKLVSETVASDEDVDTYDMQDLFKAMPRMVVVYIKKGDEKYLMTIEYTFPENTTIFSPVITNKNSPIYSVRNDLLDKYGERLPGVGKDHKYNKYFGMYHWAWKMDNGGSQIKYSQMYERKNVKTYPLALMNLKAGDMFHLSYGNLEMINHYQSVIKPQKIVDEDKSKSKSKSAF